MLVFEKCSCGGKHLQVFDVNEDDRLAKHVGTVQCELLPLACIILADSEEHCLAIEERLRETNVPAIEIMHEVVNNFNPKYFSLPNEFVN